ncbi:MAG: radical SAM protein [Nitrososphaerota archaeon]
MNLVLRSNRLRRIAQKNGKYLIANFSKIFSKINISLSDVVGDIFRIFTSHKPERNRIDNGIKELAVQFDIYKHIVFDYASICSKKLGGDWRKYNNLLTVQIAVCNFHCWYCYVPDELKSGSKEYSQYMSAEEILDTFLSIRNGNEDKYNILRISGGEPFLVPDLVLEILELVEKRDLSDMVCIWSETNLSPFIKNDQGEILAQSWLKESNRSLQEFSNFKNFVLHPCLHGTTPTNLEEVTLVKGNYYTELLEALKVLVDYKIDIYPTFSSNTCTVDGIKDIFYRLKSINEKLPLRVALIEYHLDYEPIDLRLSRSRRKGYLNGKRGLISRWDELLKQHYGVGYAQIPRSQVVLW